MTKQTDIKIMPPSDYGIVLGEKETKDAGVFYGDGFDSARRIFDEAFEYGITGKGMERHAGTSTRWEDQNWRGITDLVGLGFAYGQIIKKAAEAFNMDDRDRAIHELRGVMGYAAIAIRTLELQKERA